MSLQMETYMQNRSTLKRLYVVIDARHGKAIAYYELQDTFRN